MIWSVRHLEFQNPSIISDYWKRVTSDLSNKFLSFSEWNNWSTYLRLTEAQEKQNLILRLIEPAAYKHCYIVTDRQTFHIVICEREKCHTDGVSKYGLLPWSIISLTDPGIVHLYFVDLVYWLTVNQGFLSCISNKMFCEVKFSSSGFPLF